MLDFSDKIYKKILDLAVKHNFVSHCREYPFFTLEQEPISALAIRRVLDKNFQNPDFLCGLYVHFPFCQNRCIFCKYYSENNLKMIDEYLVALNKEIESYHVPFSNIPLANIYFGGGTPTLLSLNQIERFQNIISKFFRFNKNAQVSIEGTPESINSGNLRRWSELGVNRISLGCQSFNDDILKKVGRQHSIKIVFKAFDIIRKVDIKHTGIDLILGLPSETLKTYENTIRTVIKLSPDFVECFLLSPGGRTKMKRFHPLDSNLNSVIRLFKERLTTNGYRLYFPGNFLGFVKRGIVGAKAMNQNEVYNYNQKVSCLGFGPSSISQFSEIKYRVFSSVENYIKRIKRGLSPLRYGIFTDLDDLKRQYIISRINYYRNLSKEDYFKLFNVPIEYDFFQELQCLKRQRIISENKNKFVWHLNENEMGHKDFFQHAIKYWYKPQYIKRLLKNYMT